MSEVIVQAFEMIDIQHQQAQVLLLSPCAFELAIERFLEIAMIEETGQSIGNRKLLHCLNDGGIFQTDSGLIAQNGKDSGLMRAECLRLLASQEDRSNAFVLMSHRNR